METIGPAVKELAAILDLLKIPFFVCGSMASAARGVARATVDIDLVARLAPAQVLQLVEALQSGWYADADAIRDAIRRRRGFNLIHLASGVKFDVFPASGDFHEEQFGRATSMPFFGGVVVCPVATAEDTILSKLEWYRIGGEVSERQWSDILGLIRVTERLDLDHLRRWAERLRVADLLERALAAALPHPR